MPAALVAALMLAAATLLAVLPAALSPLGAAQALAKSYECPRVDTTAQVQTDGSLHVVEQRAFAFDGSFTAVWWTFEDLPSNAKVQVNGMRMASVDGEGNVVGDWIPLQQVTFQLAWRDAGGPGIDAWSFDEPLDTVYAFFDVEDAEMIFELDYTVVNGVQAYEDVAEVYWKYVPEGWAVDSRNVSVTIELPLPADVAAGTGDASSQAEGEAPRAGAGDVRAWGHGPLDGVVTVRADGAVTYEVPLVRAGQYAEARVVFPVAWLTNLSSEARKAHQGVFRLDTVLSQEQSWADQANAQRAWSLFLIVGLAVACAAVLAVAVLLFLRFGREYKPDFTDEYWRDVPERGTQPAVIGRLWRWDRESPDDFTATLMHLAHVGAVRIDKGSYADPKGRLVDDYYLTIDYAVADALTDPVEKATLELLFRRVAQGRPSVWLGSIREYGKKNPEDFLAAMKAWQATLGAQTRARGFFERRGKRVGAAMGVTALLAIAAGVFLVATTENFIPILLLAPTGVALLVIANYMPRRSREGNDLTARCKALRNWLRDFSSLDERPPTDVKVWGEFMVYAYLFGVAERVMAELRDVVPEVLEADGYGTAGPGYVPWYVWYAPGFGTTGAPMPSVSDLVQTSVANTVATAQAALSAASGGSSSGGGFGGGFSVGGGGGFGGGGGAR